MEPKLILWGAYFAYCAFALFMLVKAVLIVYGNTFGKPWRGYHFKGIRCIARKFAVGNFHHKLTIEMDSPEDELPPRWKITKFLAPVAGAYFPGANKIMINTRIVRNEDDLVRTLLHEICHHNQEMQGRLKYGQKGMYFFQPCEREARAFAASWHKVAKRMYRRRIALSRMIGKRYP